MLADPDVAPAATRPPLSDLRVLAVGFKDLATNALVPAPIPQLVSQPAPVTETITRATPRIYDSNDADVTAPVTLRQDMLRFQRPVLAAAKTWTYQPATRNGMPVKYRKRIQLTLSRQSNP